MKQLSLNLPLQQQYHQDDFIISACNYEVHKAIYHPELWVNGRVLIIGEHGSGKTHLSNIFSANQNGVFINIKNNDNELQFINAKALVVDDIDQLIMEEKLFHLINHAKEHHQFLLMTASHYPAFKLADLQSRINATQKFLIKTPDDELLKAIMLKHFNDKQLKVSQDVLNYLFARSIRNFHFIKELVYAIDQRSLQEKRNITLPLVKQVLQQVKLQQMFNACPQDDE